MRSPVGVDTMTTRFCAGLLSAADKPLPGPVTKAARRTLLNVLGTAVGAAHAPAIDALLTTVHDQRGGGPAVVPGRAELVHPYWAAVITGTAAHLDDFDDTHLATVIHPGAAVLGTLLALQPGPPLSGERYLSAFALGCEAQLRIGNAISPSHYDRGWHITGTCGVFGAAVAASVLLGLDRGQLAQALALASTMTLGHRESFGSMTKPLHPGKAAANGLIAARLAASGACGMADPLGDGGVLGVFADDVDPAALVHGWDGEWELQRNTFKPYPCGIVAHPAIDAAIEAATELADPAEITSVDLDCHPLVPELMGRRQPSDGLQARFSVYHAVAVGLVDGQVGLAQFGDERARAPEIARVRQLIALHPAADCPRDAARIRVTLGGADPVIVQVAHARGSVERPLTDEELLAKVDQLVCPVLGGHASAEIDAAVRRLPAAVDLTELVATIRPSGGPR